MTDLFNPTFPLLPTTCKADDISHREKERERGTLQAIVLARRSCVKIQLNLSMT